jgi:hypothetical protein
MPLFNPTPEVNIDNLNPDISITIPANFCAILARSLAITTNIIVTIGSGGRLRIL